MPATIGSYFTCKTFCDVSDCILNKKYYIIYKNYYYMWIACCKYLNFVKFQHGYRENKCEPSSWKTISSVEFHSTYPTWFECWRFKTCRLFTEHIARLISPSFYMYKLRRIRIIRRYVSYSSLTSKCPCFRLLSIRRLSPLAFLRFVELLYSLCLMLLLGW